jgi:hypothetical protein
MNCLLSLYLSGSAASASKSHRFACLSSASLPALPPPMIAGHAPLRQRQNSAVELLHHLFFLLYHSIKPEKSPPKNKISPDWAHYT